VSAVAACCFALGSTVAVCWWMPQFMRLLRTGHAGVSPATWTIYAASAGAWAIWAASQGRFLFASVQGLETVGIIAVVAMLRAWKLFAVFAFAMGTLVVVLALTTPAWLAVLGVAITAGSRVPQIRRAFTAPDVSGVSGGAWAVGIAGNVSFALRAGFEQLWAFCATCLVAAGVSLAVIVALRANTQFSVASPPGRTPGPLPS
jgi:hypothetical protein